MNEQLKLVEMPRQDILRAYCTDNQIVPTRGIDLCLPDTRLTVVIPSYNEAGFINQTLLSLGKSSVPIEIVVVDNESSDGTVDEVNTAASYLKYPVTLITHATKGPVNARKRGMDEVVAQYLQKRVTEPRYIAMIDADTLAPPDWAEAIYKTFQETGAAALGGSYHFLPELDEIIKNHKGITNYFNHLSSLVHFFIINRAALPQTRGANAAIEIVPYAAIGGAQQPKNEYGKPVKGSDVRFGEAVRDIGLSVSYIPVMTQTSARRAIYSLAKGVSQASISRMDTWVDCRDQDVNLLNQIIDRLDAQELNEHKIERATSFIYHSVFLPIITGQLEIDGLINILGTDHDLIKILKAAKVEMMGKSLVEMKNKAREIDRLYSRSLLAEIDGKINN